MVTLNENAHIKVDISGWNQSTAPAYVDREIYNCISSTQGMGGWGAEI